jgi:hypothetical protein
MHLFRLLFTPARAWASLGVILVGLTFACGPTATSTPTPAAADPFAVVRATSQAAYQSGKAHLDSSEFLAACVDLDKAKVADPDNRPEIQQALEAALQHCLTPVVEATPPQRGNVVATLALVVPTVAAQGAAAAATPAPPVAKPTAPAPAALGATPGATPGQGVPPASGATASVGATPQAIPAQGLVPWRDPQGRFAISAPPDWVTLPQPMSLFGTAVVQLGDPSGRAELDVAVDTATKAVSPELYAATMEIAMQQQVPGYAGEQFVPGSASGQPSVRRVFTFTQRDATGRDLQARSFQVTVLKGSTPYIISGSAPAEQFQQYMPTFDQMVQSFRFS